MEIILVVGVMSILLAALAPYLVTIHQSWSLADRRSEILQNGRVGMETMARSIRQAVAVVSVSSSIDPNGRLMIVDSSGNTVEFKRYSDQGVDMLGMGDGGTPSQLAGPITKLLFIAHPKDGVSITSANSLVQSVDILMDVADEEGKVATQSFSETVYLRKDILSALYYTCYASGNVTLDFLGAIGGNVHANNQAVQLSGSVTGSITDSDNGIAVSMPTVNEGLYTTRFENVAAYKPSADYVINSNYTFLQNQTYSGVYYIAGGHNATIEKHAVINGSVIAEGNITVEGQNSSVTPLPGNPAMVAGGNFVLQNFNGGTFQSNGTIYAAGSVSCGGRDSTFVPSSGTTVAIASGSGGIAFSGRDMTVLGGIVSEGDITFDAGLRTVVLSAAGRGPAVLSSRSLTFLGDTYTVNGLVYGGQDITFSKVSLTMTGAIVAGRNLSIGDTCSLTYMPSLLVAPPIFLRE